MKGVSFGGVSDKQYARIPNDGTTCAFPGCTQGRAIAEGAPARHALGDPTLWCHSQCADIWERQGGTSAPAQTPAEEAPKCGAPHPELHHFTCSKDADHPEHYHNSGNMSWYMEPPQVATLKAAVAAKYAPVTQDEVDQVAEELGLPAPNDVATAAADEEIRVMPLQPRVGQAADPEPKGTRPGVGLTSANRPADDPRGVRDYPQQPKGFIDMIQERAGDYAAGASAERAKVTDERAKEMIAKVTDQGPDSSPDIEKIVAESTAFHEANMKGIEDDAKALGIDFTPGPLQVIDPTVLDALAVSAILRIHLQTEPDALLVGALIAWKRQG